MGLRLEGASAKRTGLSPILIGIACRLRQAHVAIDVAQTSSRAVRGPRRRPLHTLSRPRTPRRRFDVAGKGAVPVVPVRPRFGIVLRPRIPQLTRPSTAVGQGKVEGARPFGRLGRRLLPFSVASNTASVVRP